MPDPQKWSLALGLRPVRHLRFCRIRNRQHHIDFAPQVSKTETIAGKIEVALAAVVCEQAGAGAEASKGGLVVA
jgi:hypothetical protein